MSFVRVTLVSHLTHCHRFLLCTAILAAGSALGVHAQAPSSSSNASKVTATRDLGSAVADDLDTLTRLWPSGRYRLTPGDVLELKFPFVSEFDQSVTVQPDGYVSLLAVGDLHVLGETVPAVKTLVLEAYEPLLRDPVVSVVLKEFDKPYFVIGGEVTRPGKYDLRGAMTLTQALAIAGGPTVSAKSSDVVLFRRFGNDLVDVKQINVKKMLARRNLAEDPVLHAGDTVFVPKSTWAVLAPFIPKPSFGFFLNPLGQ